MEYWNDGINFFLVK